MNTDKLWCRWCGDHPVRIGSMVCVNADCYNYDLFDSLELLPEHYEKWLANTRTRVGTGTVTFSINGQDITAYADTFTSPSVVNYDPSDVSFTSVTDA